MSSVLFAAPSTFRGRWRGVVVLALLIGVGGGAVLAAWSGARRTRSALPRMLAATHAADVMVSANLDVTALGRRSDLSGLATLPHAARVGTLYGFGMAPWNEHTLESQDFGDYSTAPGDDTVGRTFDQPLVLAGRLPALGAPDEVVVNDAALEDLRRKGFPARLGAKVHLAWFNFGVLDRTSERLGDRAPTPAEIHKVFHEFDARIVGRVRLPSDVTSNQNQNQPAILLSAAFGRRHVADASYSFQSVMLDDPAGLGAFERAARARYPTAGLRFVTPGDQEQSFAAIVQPYVDALRFFALVAGVTTLLVLSLALVRQARDGSAAVGTFRELGMQPRALAFVVGARGVVTVASGTVLAAVIAVGLSGRFPIGPARAAEPDPGTRPDFFVLAIGVAIIGFVLLASVAFASARLSTGARGVAPTRPRRVLVRGPSTASSLGLGRAFDGGGGLSSASLGVTFLGVVVALTTCVAALGFGHALDAFVAHPDRWGWHWDAMYDTYESGLAPATVAKLDHMRGVDAFTVGTRGTIAIGPAAISAFGLDVRRGHAAPMLLEGRLPATDREIALGARTLRDLDLHVGSIVRARDVHGRDIDLSVVGRAVIPPSLDLAENHRLGQGAILTAAGLIAIDPAPRPSFALINLSGGNPGAFRAVASGLEDAGSLLRAQRPGEVTSYAGVRHIPELLALLLGLLGIGVLAHVVISSARARRREFAILKAVGLERRQVAASILWEATALSAVSAAVALFLGTIVGRALWHRFTDDLGVSARAVVPFAVFAIVFVMVLLVANIIALLPARRSARLTTATLLRSE